jgi:hypothetical protein
MCPIYIYIFQEYIQVFVDYHVFPVDLTELYSNTIANTGLSPSVSEINEDSFPTSLVYCMLLIAILYAREWVITATTLSCTYFTNSSC